MDFIALFTYIFVTTFTPGPNNIVSMTYAVRQGYMNVLRFLAGIFCGFAIVMLICGFSNLLLVQLLPQLRHWLNLLGVVYMFYLAIHIARSKPGEDPNQASGDHTFRAGFVMQFLNVKVILYGITVFANFLIPFDPEPLHILLFSLALAGVGFVATSCWALGGNLFRKWLRRHYRAFNLTMAGLLVYTAITSLL